MRKFKSGATRDEDQTKLDPEGFISPLVIRRYAAYMHRHRIQADGSLRASDNWQKGIPRDAYIKSLDRHVLDLKLKHREPKEIPLYPGEGISDTVCAIMFNAMGYLYELLKGR